ncbi:hypothetical protein PIB30_073579 [Stylosanthes scabra]|uniref:Uncharacterized protein n=1 Tax=Stylosanthes scabra TaxID=79078 RepID=A0ABU6ZN64_9FABA|nr:hypothetical protein [Stylosanthes scabra]
MTPRQVHCRAHFQKQQRKIIKYEQKVIGTIPRGEIRYISGGFAGGSPSNSAWKRSYRDMLSVEGANFRPQAQQKEIPQITFEQSDLKSMNKNLDDPVVISLHVGEPLVHKVLLDLGSSSANVLFCSTFQKMKLSEKFLQPSNGELVGFFENKVPMLDYEGTIATVYADHKESRQFTMPVSTLNPPKAEPKENAATKFTTLNVYQLWQSSIREQIPSTTPTSLHVVRQTCRALIPRSYVTNLPSTQKSDLLPRRKNTSDMTSKKPHKKKQRSYSELASSKKSNSAPGYQMWLW